MIRNVNPTTLGIEGKGEKKVRKRVKNGASACVHLLNVLYCPKLQSCQWKHVYYEVQLLGICCALWCVRYLVGNSYFRPAQSSKPFDTSAHWLEPVGNWDNILYAEFASSCDLHLHGGGKCTRRDFLNLLTRGQCMFMHCYFVSGPTEN